jgi:hypothetical protein
MFLAISTVSGKPAFIESRMIEGLDLNMFDSVLPIPRFGKPTLKASSAGKIGKPIMKTHPSPASLPVKLGF